MKTIIADIGFIMLMVGASCDVEYSDMRVVAVLVLVGCLLMWIGGKDYEYSYEEDEETEDEAENSRPNLYLLSDCSNTHCSEYDYEQR